MILKIFINSGCAAVIALINPSHVIGYMDESNGSQ